MNTEMQVLIVGEDGAERAGLAGRFDALGCTATTAEPCAALADDGDLLVADFRGDGNWDEIAAALAADERPLLMIADRPMPVVRELSGRAAGAMVLTGSENDSGFRVALSLCSALRGRGRRTRRRRSVSGAWGRPVRPAIAI